ncbi:MFS transporter permease [Microbacterium sp. HMH0099]|uniref:MFS transporter permease n=1 Tax=Microbacterium sp. HMH0099 TaxID=3414026 RepID=UPI003BF6B4D7
MVLRRLFTRWMFPAAFVLPLWLFVGWIAFSGGSAWALLWVFIAVPSVFLTQLVLALLTRARASVRTLGVMSGKDVALFGAWHLVIVALGLFDGRAFVPLLLLSVAGALGLFWWTLTALWREARDGTVAVLRTTDGTGYIPPTREQPRSRPRIDGEVIVVPEGRRDV